MSRKNHPVGFRLGITQGWILPANTILYQFTYKQNYFVQRWFVQFMKQNNFYFYNLYFYQDDQSILEVQLNFLYNFLNSKQNLKTYGIVSSTYGRFSKKTRLRKSSPRISCAAKIASQNYFLQNFILRLNQAKQEERKNLIKNTVVLQKILDKNKRGLRRIYKTRVAGLILIKLSSLLALANVSKLQKFFFRNVDVGLFKRRQLHVNLPLFQSRFRRVKLRKYSRFLKRLRVLQRRVNQKGLRLKFLRENLKLKRLYLKQRMLRKFRINTFRKFRNISSKTKYQIKAKLSFIKPLLSSLKQQKIEIYRERKRRNARKFIRFCQRIKRCSSRKLFSFLYNAEQKKKRQRFRSFRIKKKNAYVLQVSKTYNRRRGLNSIRVRQYFLRHQAFLLLYRLRLLRLKYYFENFLTSLVKKKVTVSMNNLYDAVLHHYPKAKFLLPRAQMVTVGKNVNVSSIQQIADRKKREFLERLVLERRKRTQQTLFLLSNRLYGALSNFHKYSFLENGVPVIFMATLTRTPGVVLEWLQKLLTNVPKHNTQLTHTKVVDVFIGLVEASMHFTNNFKGFRFEIYGKINGSNRSRKQIVIKGAGAKRQTLSQYFLFASDYAITFTGVLSLKLWLI